VVGVGVEVADRVDLVRAVVGEQRADVLLDRDAVVRPGAAEPVAVEVHAAQPAVAVGLRLAGGRGDHVCRRYRVTDLPQRAIGMAEEDDVLLRHAEHCGRGDRFSLTAQAGRDAGERVAVGHDDDLYGVARGHRGAHLPGRDQRLVVRVRPDDHDGLRRRERGQSCERQNQRAEAKQPSEKSHRDRC
jgi:hypothetical protein